MRKLVSCKLLAVPWLYIVWRAVTVWLLWLALRLLVERNHVGDGAQRGGRGGAGGEQNEGEHGHAADMWQALKALLLYFLQLVRTLLLMLASSLKNSASGLNDFWSIVLYAGVMVIDSSILFLLFFRHANGLNQRFEEPEANDQEAPVPAGVEGMIV